MKRRVVSQQGLAAILGLSSRQVRNLEQAGLPKEAKGYPIPAAVRWYVGRKVAEVEARLPADLDEARLRLDTAKAQLAELTLASRRGELMSVADFDRELGGAFARVSAQLATLPTKAAPLVVGLTAQEVVTVLERVVQEIREELHRADDIPDAEAGAGTR